MIIEISEIKILPNTRRRRNLRDVKAFQCMERREGHPRMGMQVAFAKKSRAVVSHNQEAEEGEEKVEE